MECLSELSFESREALYLRIAELEQQVKHLEAEACGHQRNTIFYQRIMDTLPLNVYVYDLQQQRIIFSNRFVEQSLGYIPQQIDAMGDQLVEAFVHPEDLARMPELFSRWETVSDDEMLTAEYRMKQADGSWRWFLGTDSVFLRDHEGAVVQIIGSTLDITERKYVDAERERLLFAIEQSEDMVVITDPEGVIQYVNSAFERVSGYQREEVLGQNTRLLKSGQMDPQVYQDLWKTLTAGESWEGQFSNTRKDGSLFTEKASISPVRNAQAEIVNFVAVKRDITQDLFLAQQYVQAQKMESIGRLAGGVAHDFNNMLTVILGHVELILGYIKGPDNLIQDLQEVKQAAQSSADLTQQLLAFARKQPVEIRNVDLNKLILNIISLLQRLIGKDIELRWVPESDISMIRIDLGQVSQILTNLVVNARDALAGSGVIAIQTRNVHLDENDCRLNPELQPGAYVLLAVDDNGPGMDKDTLEHLFEPFFTTKKMGLGTGLGLATVYGIVQQSQGFIQVSSVQNQGSCFKIYWPQAES